MQQRQNLAVETKLHEKKFQQLPVFGHFYITTCLIELKLDPVEAFQEVSAQIVQLFSSIFSKTIILAYNRKDYKHNKILNLLG